ncbi:Cell death protease [Coemansia sp. RSA 1822]|nr:Cell death protease [Coemansia sp. RSA 638]KAJ2125373.1 Cell death protease [Coemansia sp. RSA 720]KAJ2545729.1 Cell death protease [Coemansia sp. RSA 1853]KAJ2564924.1 Cell death protease [Coemansia sp. RSA 1822]
MRRDTELPPKSDFAVDTLPFADSTAFASLEQYAGQLPMSSSASMFFWLISNTTNAFNHDKLLIWLNGGPGCTSLDGVFMENGPFKFSGAQLVPRAHSFSEQFDVLYIDQPFGTGFSTANTTDYEHTFVNSTQTLLEFLQRFYEVFPEMRKRQLFLAGESEAGTYIPYLADAVLKMPESTRFDLRGLMIGNGWVDPFPMYMSYLELLRRRNMLTSNVQAKLESEMSRCAREFSRAPQPVHTSRCESIASVFLDDGGPEPGMCYNQYDLRLTDSHPSCGMNWPPEVGVFTDYLNRKDVQQAINVQKAPSVWTECNNAVHRALGRDESPPSVTLLPSILQQVPVLFFVGAEDYLCNEVGTEWTVGNLTWAGDTGFSSTRKRSVWTIDGQQVGSVESDRGLTYALIHNASHMVGVDRPRELLDLFTLFTNASSSNLRFRSSFRSSDVTQPMPSQSHIWIVASIVLVALVVVGGVVACRARLFAWWVERRGYGSLGPVDDAEAVDDRLDDAFVMSEFSFKPVLKSVDHNGLLLDDSMASSPDDDIQIPPPRVD